ncbi:hypothetical protein K469DRAFT_646867 [Zopfia rhizophila CBS 207.26]|uniref:SprT-like domain-containing protein n=1 Tax=Zopfia rhizophila CBS 207.26 TaxID=1314779 RepID=A0A6A6D832_9PEZI|nr:hypothetical protein K469DRAFT_646867 [Zopfia rhizophila CBS 207.26]
MARLRKASPTDPAMAFPAPANPKRSSPRKTIRESPSKRELRYTSQDPEDSFLVPKVPSGDTPVRKQRTLKPVSLNTTLLRKLSTESLASPEKSSRRTNRDDRLGYMYSRSLARTVVKSQQKKGREEKKIEVAVGEETALDENEEPDQSLWCGDEGDEVNAENEAEGIQQEQEEEEEEEEDEDPIVDVKNRRRQLQSQAIKADAQPEMPPPLTCMKLPHRKAHSMISNWAQEVIDLTSSPEPPASFVLPPPPPLAKPEALVFTSSRPTSSSSNNVHAILNFSPTPTKQKSPRKAPPISRPSTPSLPPASPSKLVSPSKKKKHIPDAPELRPSLEAFWSAEVVNGFNDKHSPSKPLLSPRKQKWLESLEKGDAGSDSDSSFPSPTTSPKKKSQSQSPTREGPTTVSPTVAELRAQRKEFAANKHAIAETFLKELDDTITNGRISELSHLTGGIKLLWSCTLKTTAGRANWRREQIRLRTGPLPTDIRLEIRHHCSIELAEKVIDDETRLYNVLAHEYCHLTTFMISNQRNNPHGAEFKSWAKKLSQVFADKGVEVTTKHSYQISYKYVWECVACGYEFKRHSKSVDPERHSCGRCKGKLVQTKPVPRNGSREKSKYQVFVKANYTRVKRELETKGLDAALGKVMEAIGKEYREAKEKEKSKASEAVGEVELAFEALNLEDGDV